MGRRLEWPEALEWANKGKREFWRQVGVVFNQGWQQDAADSDARFKVIPAGARSGKSFYAAQEACPTLCQPGKQGWIIPPEYSLGAKEFGYIHERLVEQLHLPTVRDVFNVTTGQMLLKFPWGSWVEVKSSKYPESLQAEELDFVIIAEPASMRQRVWDHYVRPRLSSRKGWAILGGTPVSLQRIPVGLKWFKEMAQRGRSSDPKWKDWATFQGSTWENPHNLENKEELQRELTEAVYQAVCEGQFVAYVGLVFRDEWDHDANVIPHDKAWKLYENAHKRIGTVDWGYTNPCALGALGFHPEYIVKIAEWYQRRQTIDQVKDQALKMQQKWRIQGWICDPEEPGHIEIFRNAGLRAIGGNNAIQPGLDCLRRHIKRETPHGRGYMVNVECHNTIWEYEEGYRYPETREEAFAGAEKPVDANNHAISGDRYGIYTLEVGPKGKGTYKAVVVPSTPWVKIGKGEF